MAIAHVRTSERVTCTPRPGTCNAAGGRAARLSGRVIEAIIWDMGGVLVNAEAFAPARDWDRRLGLAPGQVAHTVFYHPLERV